MQSGGHYDVVCMKGATSVELFLTVEDGLGTGGVVPAHPLVKRRSP